MPSSNGSLKVEGEREIFRGRVFRVVNREFRFPNGHRSTWNVIDHPGAVAIVPRFENGDVLLLRQLRPATGETLWEIPAGTIEKGESPLETARREIVEETGYRARRWKRLHLFYSAPGFCNERMFLYEARELAPAAAERDTDEVIRPVRLPLAKALRMAASGRIRDAKTLVGLLLLRE